MPAWPDTFERVVSLGREFFRRHWQRALIIRERLLFTEETINLLLAGVIGVVGAAANLIYFWAHEALKWAVFGTSGDLVEIAAHVAKWQVVLIPTLGGLAAGLVL